MPRHATLHKLSPTTIRRLPDGRHHDGGGLYLHVRGLGARTWEFRYQRPDGRWTWAGFGSYDVEKIDDVRAVAAAWRAIIKLGRDPALESVERPDTQNKKIGRPGFSFTEMFDAFMAAQSGRWTNQKNIAQWHSTMHEFVMPFIGDKDVLEINTNDIEAILIQPLKRPGTKKDGLLFWSTLNVTAARLQGRIENVLDFAIAKSPDAAKFKNPAAWNEIKYLVGPRENKRSHHPALDHEKAPDFWTRLDCEDCLSADALRFTVLTACRTAEAIDMPFAEIDWDKRLWTIPWQRLKTRRKTQFDHVVALSDEAFAILRQRQQANPRGVYVFGVPDYDAPPSNGAMLALLDRMGVGDHFTVHGMRSTFRDYIGEETTHESELAEFALAHVIADRARIAYQRKSGVKRRRAMMQDWSDYLHSRPPAPSLESEGNVIAWPESKMKYA